MKKYLIFTVIFWMVVLSVASKFASGRQHRVHYYHSKNYESAGSLFIDLAKQRSTDGIFEWCCDCIQFYAEKFGFSYEELNIVLFVILQPAMIIYLVITVAILLFTRRKPRLLIPSGQVLA